MDERKNYNNIIIIFLFAFLIFIFFRKIITKELVFWFDFKVVEYPRRAYMAEMIRLRKIPLWIPYIFGGYPLIGSHPSFFLYPFVILLSLFVKNNQVSLYAVELSLLFQIWLGGVSMYFFLKEFGVSKPSSVFGSILFSFSLPTIVRTQHTAELTGLIWIPIIFYSLLKTFKEKNLFWASISGLFIGICVLGSHIQFYFYLLGVVLFFLLYNIIVSKERKKILFLSVVIIVVGLFIAAPRLLPELEYVKLSSRIHEMVPGYTPLKMILALFTPHIFGKGTGPNTYWGGYQSFWMFVEYSSYIGIISLLFLILSYKVFNEKKIRFFFYLLGFAIIFMYGKYNPFQMLISLFLPGLRFHVRFMTFFVFSAAVISSFSLDFLSEHIKEKGFKKFSFYGLLGALVIIITALIWNFAIKDSSTLIYTYKYKVIFMSILLFGIFLLISFLLIYLRHTEQIISNWFKYAVSVFLFVDLFVMGSYFSGKKPDLDFYKTNALIDFLQRSSEVEKVRIYSPRMGYFYSNSRSLIFRLEVLDGHIANKLDRCVKFEELFKDNMEKYLDLYNVKYAIENKIISGRNAVGLRKRETCLPRAWIVHKEKKIADSLMVPYMKSDEFNPWKEVVVPEEIEPHCSDPEGSEGKDIVSISIYQDEKIELDIDVISNGYLVLSEHYYPGWKAFVDGRRTDIIRANYLFRAIPVTKGEHKIVLLFKPNSFYLGLVLFCISLLWLIGIITAKILRKRIP